MFGIMSFIFIAAFGIIIFSFLQGITTWNKNNHSPRITVPARIVAKREDVSRHTNNVGMQGYHTTTSTSYFVTFQVESEDRLELQVPGSEYGMLAEGDNGRLSFQGTRYLSFERVS